MSAKQSIHRQVTHQIGSSFPEHLQHLLPRMTEIYLSLFNVPDKFDINNLLKFRGDQIALNLFWDKYDKLAGFALAGIQTFTIGRKKHAIFSAGAYSDLNYSCGQAVARFALTESLKYKIKHPFHKLAYLCEALSPAPYSLATRILPKCYPHPELQTPTYVEKIIEQVRNIRKFDLDPDSKFVVKFTVERKFKELSKIHSSSKREKCEFYQFYLKLNPHFNEGKGLLVYMPLNIKNILLGINNLLKGNKRRG